VCLVWDGADERVPERSPSVTLDSIQVSQLMLVLLICVACGNLVRDFRLRWGRSVAVA